MDGDKKRTRFRDDIPRLGPGLFVDERARASAEAAYNCAVLLCSEQDLETQDAAAWLKESLLEAARHYWADYDYDKRTPAVDIREEIEPFRKALGKVVEISLRLSADARAALRAKMHRALFDADVDQVEQLLGVIGRLQSVCDPIASVRGRKGPRAQDRVTRCCERLWKVQERLTGRPFSKSFDKKFDQRGIVMDCFARPDAQFVFAVLKSIDEKVTISQVEDGLRSHPASEERGK